MWFSGVFHHYGVLIEVGLSLRVPELVPAKRSITRFRRVADISDWYVFACF